MKMFIASLFALAALAPAKPVFTGTITDSMCANANHAPMRMGPRTPAGPGRRRQASQNPRRRIAKRRGG